MSTGPSTSPTNDPQPALKLEDVTIRLNGSLIVRDISFQAEPKQVLAIIGQSGCGKSVLLKTLVGLMKYDASGANPETSGVARFGDVDLLSLGEEALVGLRRRVAYIAQIPVPLPLSIYENIAFGVRYHAQNRQDDIQDVVLRSLKAVGLLPEVERRLDESAKALSPGQLQRLSMARAVAVGAEMLLLDEPCAFMDPMNLLRIEDLVAELKDTVSILIVSHNMQQAARVSDSTMYMALERLGDQEGWCGVLVEHGPTARIFTRPDDERTEGYITGRFG